MTAGDIILLKADAMQQMDAGSRTAVIAIAQILWTSAGIMRAIRCGAIQMDGRETALQIIFAQIIHGEAVSQNALHLILLHAQMKLILANADTTQDGAILQQ